MSPRPWRTFNVSTKSSVLHQFLKHASVTNLHNFEYHMVIKSHHLPYIPMLSNKTIKDTRDEY